MNNDQEEEITECQACGGPLEAEDVNLEDYKAGKLFIMEHVRALVCQNCGEVWLPPAVTEEFAGMIETIKLRRKKKNEK